MLNRQRSLLVALLLAFAGALISVFGFFYFRDNFATHYPIKVISAAMFRAGQIPWWNFYDGGGQPLAGNPNTLTFYPDNFLYLFLPAHVAFNLHFLLHLAFAWFAMRALCRQTGTSRAAADFAATMYAMSGLALSATAFYNLITAVALIPFALWAVERMLDAAVPRHAWLAVLYLGAAFGLIGLAGEPVVALSAALCVVVLSVAKAITPARVGRIALAALVAIAIALPQIIAYAEIAKEVERAHGFSAQTVLNASLLPRRIAEIAIGPIVGLLTDPGHAEFRGRLFSTIFLGIIVVPALFVRGRARYLVIAAAMLFLALGRYNPVVKSVVESAPSLRVARYPEKFAIALIVALVVLAAAFVEKLTAKWRVIWGVITFVPLAAVIVRGAPIDWFAFYRVPAMPAQRVCGSAPIAWGTRPAREEFREAARTLQPIFGAAGGVRYAANRSPEGMHSLMSRIVAERVAATPLEIRMRYLRMCGCADSGALPMAWIVPRAIGIHSVNEEVAMIESGAFDEHTAALAPAELGNLVSPADARVTRYAESLQDISIDVSASAPALLFVNQSFFRAWSARIGDRELSTLPLDIDRLGIVLPAGQHTIELHFGRHRTAVVISWVLSLLLLLIAAIALRIEVLDRRAGEIERAADENVRVA